MQRNYKSMTELNLKEGKTYKHNGVDIVKEYTTIYGEHVNSDRAVPYVLDGLKPSYRKQIYGAIKENPKGKMVKVVSMIGSIMGKYYAHGDASLTGVVDELVHQGIFDGQGAFSRKFIDGTSEKMASMRYVECRMNEHWYDTISKLLPYVPTFRNEFGNQEPVYLPTPIPFCLIYGSKGLGLGARTVIPGFSARSLLYAYLDDDKSKLESYYDYKMKSVDGDVWTDPFFRVNYSYKVYRYWYDFSSRESVVVEGDTKLFVPSYTEQLQAWLDEGRVFTNDLSDEKNLMVFSILSGMKYPSVDELEKEVKKSVNKNITFEVKATYNGSTRPISIRDWIDITYNNYSRLLDLYKKDNLEKLDFQQLIIDNFEKVAEMALDKKTDEQIIKKLKLSEDIVSAITSKSIKYLQNFNYEKENAKLEEQREQFRFENDSYINNLIKEY